MAKITQKESRMKNFLTGELAVAIISAVAIAIIDMILKNGKAESER